MPSQGLDPEARRRLGRTRRLAHHRRHPEAVMPAGPAPMTASGGASTIFTSLRAARAKSVLRQVIPSI